MDRPQWAGKPVKIPDENMGAPGTCVHAFLPLAFSPGGPEPCLPGAALAEEAGGPAGPGSGSPGSMPSIPHPYSASLPCLTLIRVEVPGAAGESHLSGWRRTHTIQPPRSDCFDSFAKLQSKVPIW